MSGSQVTVIVLIVVAFALGWWGHGWRQGARSKGARGPGELDAALRAVLTAFQAALSVWQAEWPPADAPSPLAGHALAAFQRERAALAALELDHDARPEVAAALQRARRATDRLAAGLAPLAAGEPLGRERERTLVGAERALIAARYQLLTSRPPG
jgi:hypothetical protein